MWRSNLFEQHVLERLSFPHHITPAAWLKVVRPVFVGGGLSRPGSTPSPDHARVPVLLRRVSPCGLCWAGPEASAPETPAGVGLHLALY